MRNIGATLTALIAANLAAKPFISLITPYFAGRTFSGREVLVSDLVGLVPTMVAAFVFGSVIGLLGRTSRPALASLTIGIGIAALLMFGTRCGDPALECWLQTIGESLIEGAIAAGSFALTSWMLSELKARRQVNA
jgi:hypothetical protein